MKRLFVVMALANIFFLAYSQDVKVNINNQDATITEECAYRINGICSSEDIGGVDVEIVYSDNITWAVFTNYNEYPISVLYEVSRKGNGHCAQYTDYSNERIRNNISFFVQDGACGSIVLGANGSKKIKLSQFASVYGSWTYVQDYSCLYSIRGLIVRKLSK